MMGYSYWELGNKLGNLTLLILFCRYLIRRYVIPYAQKILAERAQQLTTISVLTVEAQEKCDYITKEMDQEQNEAILLVTKIEQWKAVLQEKKAHQASTYKAREEKIAAYSKKRAEGLCVELSKRALMPCVVIQVTEQVNRFFSSEKNRLHYQKKALEKLVLH